MDRLVGRAVMVTGATGIAAAAARLFAAEGARVFVVSRTASSCQSLVDSIVAQGGAASHAVADLTDAGAAAAAVQEGLEWLGRIDGLFNVAGGSGRRFGDGPLHTLDAAAWEQTARLNTTSHVLVSAAVLRAMLGQSRDGDGQRGSIVNMSSVLAWYPVPELFATHAYAAAKGAISSLTIASAAYYASEGIRINAVAPGLTTSRMSERAAADPATQAFARSKQPLTDGFIPPQDVAAAALFLLSPEARAVTGQVIGVDAGWAVTNSSDRSPTPQQT